MQQKQVRGQLADEHEFETPPVRRRAPVDWPILDIIADRWSPRAIDASQPVPREVVLRLFEAARWAPSASNVQPWRFLLFDDEVPADQERARACLKDSNAWARNAPVLVLGVVETIRLRADGTSGPNRLALYDVGAAVMSLAYQAVEEGIICHQMAGFDVDKASEEFNLPETCLPAAMIALGYPGLVRELPEKDRVREDKPRARRPVEETVHHGTWNRSLGLAL